MRPDEQLDVDLLDAPAALHGIAEDWRRLWRRSLSTTPFQAPDWLLPWWEAFGVGELQTLALRKGGRLVGLAPLYGYEDGTLAFIGRGNTDYLDVIVDPELEEAASAALIRYVASLQWDRCEFQQLQPDSPLLRVSIPKFVQAQTSEEAVCPQLRLPKAGGDLSDVIPSKFYKKLEYYGRRTAREGEVVIERADDANLDELLDALIRLHGERWAERDESGVLDDRDVQTFHAQVIGGMLDEGVLRLYGLRLDGRIVAVYYGFLHDGRAYYYLSGFDPELSSLSLGHQIVYHAIAEAHREGARVFDFLRGGEDYKYRWGCEDRRNRRLVLSRHPELDGSGVRAPAESAGAR